LRFSFSIALFLFSFGQISYGLGLSYHLNSPKSTLGNKPPVILLHGLVSSKETWEPVLKGLQDEFGEVWSLDLPGYGDSYKVPHKTLKEVKDALNQFLQEHKIQSPIVIAHSMGAQLTVLCYDLLKPSALIIEDMDMQQRKRPVKDSLQSFDSGFTTRSELLKALAKADYYKPTIDMIDSQFVVKEKDRFFAKINPSIDFHYRENVSSNAEVKSAWKSLPSALPILVLQASKGSATSEQGLRFMKQSHSKIEVKKIAASEHSIHRSRPKEFLAAIKSFWTILRSSKKTD
jgi:pimeloyl-ACP methyl ester carboxylesterase